MYTAPTAGNLRFCDLLIFLTMVNDVHKPKPTHYSTNPTSQASPPPSRDHKHNNNQTIPTITTKDRQLPVISNNNTNKKNKTPNTNSNKHTNTTTNSQNPTTTENVNNTNMTKKKNQ